MTSQDQTQVDELDTLLIDFVPHYGHQYCNETCPRFRAKRAIDQYADQRLLKLLDELEDFESEWRQAARLPVTALRDWIYTEQLNLTKKKGE